MRIPSAWASLSLRVIGSTARRRTRKNTEDSADLPTAGLAVTIQICEDVGDLCCMRTQKTFTGQCEGISYWADFVLSNKTFLEFVSTFSDDVLRRNASMRYWFEILKSIVSSKAKCVTENKSVTCGAMIAVLRWWFAQLKSTSLWLKSSRKTNLKQKRAEGHLTCIHNVSWSIILVVCLLLFCGFVYSAGG